MKKLKKSKGIISVILTLLMIVSIIPMGTISASALTGDQRTDIINVAIGEMGNTNGSKYTFGAGNVSWCAYFIVWCARQANIDSSIIKTTGWADADDLGVKYYSRGSYTPKKGDIIIFDYVPYSTNTPASSYGDHVGLVEYVEGNTVHTIEGNSSPSPNAVRRHSYDLTNSNIKGYGAPAYKGPTPSSHTVDTKYGKNFTAYPKAKITASNIFDANHNQISSTAWIGTTDKCTINEVYTDGCCKVTYPLDDGGTKTAYSKISLFNIESGHAETPTIKWWVSDSEYGDTPSSFKQGNRYYLCYKLYDSVTGKDWNSVSSNNYKVKITFYYPDGSVFYSNETTNADNSWISSVFVKTGTFKYGVEISGDFTFSGSRTFTVNENPKKIYANTNSVDLKKGSTESVKIYVWTDGYCDKNTFLNWSASNSNITCVWGEWNNGKIPLTINANSVGSTELTLSVKENDSEKVLHSIKVNVYIRTDPFYITYDANGGSPSFKETTDSYGKITITSKEPTKTGYSFSGWNTSANANNGSGILISGKTITLTQDMTFYAIWQPNTYIVKYNANGGTGTMQNSSHTYDTAKTLTTNGFTRTGYNFAGWSTDSSATATQYGDEASVKNLTSTNGATVNLYARWKPIDYTVVYNANGGTGTMSDSNYTYDTAKALSVNKFTKEGYKFLGWSKSSTATTPTYTDGQSVKNLLSTSGKVTLYAVWQKNTVTVSSIAVNAMPSKTVYTVGEAFSSSGLSIKVNMSDGTSNIVTNGFTVSSPDMSTAGTKAVTVTYSGKSTYFNINVNNPSNTATLKIGSATAAPGNIVQIPINISNANISMLNLTVSYDKAKLKYVSSSESAFDLLDVNSSVAGKITFSGISENSISNGILIVLTFEVIASDNSTAQITASINDAYDTHEVTQTLTVEPGTVKIASGLLGDVNSDGKVNIIDARWLLQVSSGNRVLTDEQKAVADVNGDGKINIIDARWLLQVSSGNRTL